MKFKNIILCFSAIAIALSISGCKENTENVQEVSHNENLIENSDANKGIDYSKYVGTYSIISEEGTTYESSETLTITNIDGNIIDFEYEYQPPRHTIEFTAGQGIFTDDYTALADGTYSFDEQTEEIVTYEFKFKEDSIDFRWFFLGESDNTEYTTFYLNEKIDVQSNQNNTESSTNDNAILCTNTSIGVDNPYTELIKGGSGRQFIMTIDEFVEKYNSMLQEIEDNKLRVDKEDYITELYGEEIGNYLYQLDMEKAKVGETELFGKNMTTYTFCNVSKLNGVTDAHLSVYCYSNSNKIFAIYYQVSDKWYKTDSVQYAKRIKNPVSADSDYTNIPTYFSLNADDIFKTINSEHDEVFDEINEVGSISINFKDGVNYRYYDSTTKDGEIWHGLIMYSSTKEFTGVPKITIHY